MHSFSHLTAWLICLLALTHHTAAKYNVETIKTITCTTYVGGSSSIHPLPRTTFAETTHSHTTVMSTSTVYVTVTGMSASTTIVSATTVTSVCPTTPTALAPAVHGYPVARPQAGNKMPAAGAAIVYPVSAVCYKDVTFITTTLQVQTTTSTVTETPIVTVSTATVCATSFLVQATGGTVYDGEYAQLNLAPGSSFGSLYAVLITDESAASNFNISDSAQLYSVQEGEGYFANEVSVASGFNGIYFDNEYSGGLQPFPQPTCAIAANASISCVQADGRSIFEYCPLGSLFFPLGYIGLVTAVEADCTGIDLIAIPAL